MSKAVMSQGVTHACNAVHLYSGKLFFKQNDSISHVITLFGFDNAIKLISEHEKKTLKLSTCASLLGISKNLCTDLAIGSQKFVTIPSVSELNRVLNVSRTLNDVDNGLTIREVSAKNNVSIRTVTRYKKLYRSFVLIPQGKW